MISGDTIIPVALYSTPRILAVRFDIRYNARMNKPLKITKIGNSAGIVLSKDVLKHLGRQIGEEVTLVLKPGGIELVAGEPDFEEQMAAAREVMARRKRALQELAK